MADVKTISISTKQPGSLSVILRHAFIWSFLVGAEAASHLLFGGSWVIDVMILTALILLIAHQASNQSGMSVAMTPAEVRLWVAAGMPNDIKSWRLNRNLAESA